MSSLTSVLASINDPMLAGLRMVFKHSAGRGLYVLSGSWTDIFFLYKAMARICNLRTQGPMMFLLPKGWIRSLPTDQEIRI